MLKLSTKSSYGLRACLTLATAEKRLSSSQIAERDDIPKRYLEQILSALRQSGLVESTRGARGGYALSREATQISIADLVQSVEGELPPMLCSNPGLRSETCREDSPCDCRGLCSELESSVAKVLSGTTLADILQQKSSLIPIITGDAHDGGSPLDGLLASPTKENDKRYRNG
jgi:Rrf2 family transcriptional regulator, cysteine metabolism repressor